MRSLGYLMYWMPGILLIITLAPGFSKSAELETSTSRDSSGTAKERNVHIQTIHNQSNKIQHTQGVSTRGSPWVVGGALFIIFIILGIICCCCGLPLCIWGCIACSQRNRRMAGQGVPGRAMGPYPQGVPQPYYSNMGMQQQYSQQYPPQQMA